MLLSNCWYRLLVAVVSGTSWAYLVKYASTGADGVVGCRSADLIGDGFTLRLALLLLAMGDGSSLSYMPRCAPDLTSLAYINFAPILADSGDDSMEAGGRWFHSCPSCTSFRLSCSICEEGDRDWYDLLLPACAAGLVLFTGDRERCLCDSNCFTTLVDELRRSTGEVRQRSCPCDSVCCLDAAFKLFSFCDEDTSFCSEVAGHTSVELFAALHWASHSLVAKELFLSVPDPSAVLSVSLPLTLRAPRAISTSIHTSKSQ